MIYSKIINGPLGTEFSGSFSVLSGSNISNKKLRIYYKWNNKCGAFSQPITAYNILSRPNPGEVQNNHSFHHHYHLNLLKSNNAFYLS